MIDFGTTYDQVYVIEEEESLNARFVTPWSPSKYGYLSSPEALSVDGVLPSQSKLEVVKKKRKEVPPACDALLAPRSMDTPAMRVDVAVSFWFRHLLTIPRLPDALQGYLEILGPMYSKASPSSLLHQATRALALAGLSNGQRSALIRVEARKLYAKALRETGEAIRDPKQARSNELLMAIMLFSLYETITSSDNTRALWNRHINGAVTLVKMRGDSMKSDPTSLHLFRAVRAHMVRLIMSFPIVPTLTVPQLTATIQQQKTVEDFPTDQGWHLDEQLELNAAHRLTLICMDLPNIKFYAQDLLAREKTSSTIVAMMKLIRVAKSTDNALEHWALTLDPIWEPRINSIIADEPEDLETAPFWKGPVHVYNDLSVVSVWNDYRLSRIFCQAVILGCVAALPHQLRSRQVQQVADQAVSITQQIVDDFCSSVPFLFGLPSEFEAKKVSKLDQVGKQFAHASFQNNMLTSLALRASGAYHAAWPLWVMRTIPTIPKNQREWLSARFLSIGRTWGLSEDQMLNMAQRHAMSTGPQFSYEEFGELQPPKVSPRGCASEFLSPTGSGMSAFDGRGRNVA